MTDSFSGKTVGIMKKLNSLWRRIKRLVDYIPIIWKGYDFDYAYALELFLFQLERTANQIETNGHLVNSDWVVGRIRTAIKLANLGFNEGYSQEVHDRFEKDYGPSKIITNEYEDSEDLFEITIWYEKAKFSQQNEQIHEDLHEELAYAYIKEERARELFFKILQKDLRTWWD
jgi:hypothetical protein